MNEDANEVDEREMSATRPWRRDAVDKYAQTATNFLLRLGNPSRQRPPSPPNSISCQTLRKREDQYREARRVYARTHMMSSGTLERDMVFGAPKLLGGNAQILHRDLRNSIMINTRNFRSATSRAT